MGNLNKLKNIVSEIFGKNDKYQKIGAAVLILSLVLLFLEQIVFCYITLGIVLVIDLYLVRKKEKTITRWWRPKFPKLIDTIITISLAGIFIWLNPVAGLYFLFGTVSGHLNGDW